MAIQTVRLVFDSDLDRPEKNITALRFPDTPDLQIPETLVRQFRVEIQMPDGTWQTLGIYDNHQRLRKIAVRAEVLAVKCTVLQTGSGKPERIFAFDVM